MKRVFSLIMTALLLLSVFGCTGGDAADLNDPNLGKYEAISIRSGDFTMDAAEAFEEGFWIELQPNGKCKLFADGASASGKWTLDGTAFTVEGGGLDCTGTLENGVIDLAYDEEMRITLVNAAYQAPAAPAASTGTDGASFTEPKTDAANAPAKTEPSAAASAPAAIDPNADLSYRFVSYTVTDSEGHGTTIGAADAGDLADTSLVLRADGTAALVLAGGDPIDLFWAEDGKLTIGSVEYPVDFATFTRASDTEIDIDLYGVFYHMQLDSVAPAASAAAPQPTEAPAATTVSPADWWNGKWYGWLTFYEGYGSYADWEDMILDSVVEIDYNAGTFKLWGYQQDDDEPLIDATVEFVEGTTPVGAMVSTGGISLMADLSYGDWVVDPGDSSVVTFDHMIEIIDMYHETEADGYVCLLYLRPWGMLWDDVPGNSTEDMPYIDMMPNHYDWYLEQLGLASAAAPQPTEAPAATAANNPGNGEPYGSSDGVIPHDKLAALYRWLNDMDSAFRRALTFDDLSNAVGKAGFDKQDGDGKYHAAYWYDGEKYYVTVTFYANADGTWGVGSITTGLSSSEYNAADISGFPAVGNRAAGSSPVQSVTLETKIGFSGPAVAVTASVPTENWFAKVQSSSIRYNNAPTESAVNSNSPGIRIECKESLEKIDFYKDSFENLVELGSRTIGGIPMQGRSYKNIGMEWIEYYGEVAEGVWASIKLTGLDPYAGSEADAILGSITFTVK